MHFYAASPDDYFIPADSSSTSDAYTAAMQIEESSRRPSETINGVRPNVFVDLAAAHFKRHTSTGANKSGLCQLKGTVYALIYFYFIFLRNMCHR